MKSPKNTLACALLLLLASGFFAPGRSQAVEIPPEGACPPQTIQNQRGEAQLDEDAVPSRLRPGSKVDLKALSLISDYLPPEIWERRRVFFYEGQTMELGDCYRRYAPAPFFEADTSKNAGKAKLDVEGNLIDYAGAGLPFPIDQIEDSAPDAGMKWAWNYRYRYEGAGYRGRFRLMDVSPRARKIERFEGRIFMLPLHGVPGIDSVDERNRFVAGGEFLKPSISRGLSWRQFRREAADQDFTNSDDVFVYLPSSRKVRRAPPQNLEGLYLPSYTRANSIDNSSMTLPSGQTISDVSLAAAEPVRKGFIGLVIRPNAYRFSLLHTQDVLAPINTTNPGFPSNLERSYGPSGLSVASDRWDLRRAVVLRGVRKEPEGNIGEIKLYIDAQTLAPLYLVAKRPNGSIAEVGIYVGSFSGDGAKKDHWKGSGSNYGMILPVAQTFLVSGSGGWVREAFEMRSDPPSDEDQKRFQTTRRLQLEGR